MDPIYVTGHRNPDTDSIVAAMAYAALRNALGDREYEAACLGHVSDETNIVLKRFGFQPPKRSSGMYTQLKDLDFDTPPFSAWYGSRKDTWKHFMERPYIFGAFQWIAIDHRGEAVWPAISSKSGAIDIFLQKKGNFYLNKALAVHCEISVLIDTLGNCRKLISII